MPSAPPLAAADPASALHRRTRTVRVPGPAKNFAPKTRVRRDMGLTGVRRVSLTPAIFSAQLRLLLASVAFIGLASTAAASAELEPALRSSLACRRPRRSRSTADEIPIDAPRCAAQWRFSTPQYATGFPDTRALRISQCPQCSDSSVGECRRELWVLDLLLARLFEELGLENGSGTMREYTGKVSERGCLGA